MNKPVIGIFAFMKPAPTDNFHKVRLSALSMSYTEAVIRHGGIPMVLPYTESVDAMLEMLRHCDGVILPGGVDVDPYYFNEDPNPYNGEVDPILDKLELTALKYLEEKKIPVLGICRGCQVMNIYAGGDIYQDINSQYVGVHMHRQKQERCYPVHEVRIDDLSNLKNILSCNKTRVNSIHHQAVRKLGRGFRASAIANDGVIEAIEHENGIWFAVQWHPEDLLDTVPEMNGIFKELIEKSRKNK